MEISYFSRLAYIDGAWLENVRWTVEKGTITSVSTEGVTEQCIQLDGPVVPTVANIHSHAFQRAMAGMAEVVSNPADDFWSWRKLMYQVALGVSVDQMGKIARYLYCELLKQGFTQVCEFHYLHHDEKGNHYQNKAEMAVQLAQAAVDVGMGITLLPTLYSYSDFNSKETTDEQRRFLNTTDSYLQIVDAVQGLASGSENINSGVAFHSLRAVELQQIERVIKSLPLGTPKHIHISEQQKEVEECIEATSLRPVELLLENVDVDESWCLVHATHINHRELTQLIERKIVTGLCPTTEANLGDGIFPAVDYAQKQGRWAVGTDSHVNTSLVSELRLLEYSQRLRDQKRNRLFDDTTPSVGEFLFSSASTGGQVASGQSMGLSVGKRADFIVLDNKKPFYRKCKF